MYMRSSHIRIKVFIHQEEKQLLKPPLVTGLSVMGLGVSLGFNCGYAVNPARDLAPRIFTGEAQ